MLNVERLRLDRAQLGIRANQSLCAFYFLYFSTKGLSARELTLARNEICARHVRGFKGPELKEYFRSRFWYRESPDYYRVNDTEKENAKKILEYQQKHGLTW